jgi:outer membrane protein
MFVAKIAIPSLVAAALALSVPAMAQTAQATSDGKKAGDFMVRGRLIGVLPDATGTITPAAIGGNPEISDEATPEVDFSYFLTDHIALELIAASPKHTVNWNSPAAGLLNLGDVRLLPPTLALQYHFMPSEAFSPYVGAGVNYTWFYDKSGTKTAGITSVSYENNFGAALQAGLDYHLAGNWYANIDIKHIFLSTTVKLNGGALAQASVDIDPTIVGVGVGYKF